MINLIVVIAAGSLGIAVIYWLVLLIAILRYKTLTKRSQSVSVIVCAHNEFENLKALIPILLEQEHSDFEVIIVDDRSDDGTYDYMLEAQSDQLKFVCIDQVHDHINAKKFALTMGIKAAKNDILLLSDADCVPASKQWIKEMTGSYTKQTDFILGVSQYMKKPGLLNQFIQFETHITAMNYMGYALAGNPYMAVGRNLSYKKTPFLEQKGFSKIQEITGGDDDLLVNDRANKKNTRVVLGIDALTYSIPESTWSSHIRQKIRHLSVGKHYRFKDKFLLGIQHLSNLVFWSALTILALQTNDYLIPAGLLFFRIVFLTILVKLTSKKFGYRMNIWLVPVMDILHVGYTTLFGVVALFTKKVRWKK